MTKQTTRTVDDFLRDCEKNWLPAEELPTVSVDKYLDMLNANWIEPAAPQEAARSGGRFRRMVLHSGGGPCVVRIRRVGRPGVVEREFAVARYLVHEHGETTYIDLYCDPDTDAISDIDIPTDADTDANPDRDAVPDLDTAADMDGDTDAEGDGDADVDGNDDPDFSQASEWRKWWTAPIVTYRIPLAFRVTGWGRPSPMGDTE